MGLVDVERTQRAVIWRIARPEKANALDAHLRAALEEALGDAADLALPLVITSATPGMFMGGADVAELRTRTLDDALRRANVRFFAALEAHPFPTVALVDGPALGGGCELALACDFRLATTRSVWGQPEVRLGLIPSGGALWRLPRLVGWAATTDLVLTGRRVHAAEALRMGLVHRVMAPEEVPQALEELLADLAASPMTAKRVAKEIMHAAWNCSGGMEALAQAVCIGQPETQQRLERFVGRGDGREGA